ncbi:MAG TPA: hypothetical protein VMS43_00565 [Allosphingosinicella sp.]|nr:hypothetical protein [Allosphingosinicella sp.]
MKDPAARPAPSPLDRFRDLLAADEALQDELAADEAGGRFVEAALALARRHGIALEPGHLAPLMASDPLGLWRLEPPALGGIGWPPRGWLPFQLAAAADGALGIDWAHFGGIALDQPFFADAARRALARPFNRLLRCRTGLDDFIDRAPDGLRPPDGLIFHMSRCGSTLVARMLAAVPGTSLVSEAAPLDAMVHLALRSDWPEARRIAGLRAMAGALGRRPSARIIVKLNAWHALALPLFRAAFPGVPWLFLYREPAAILASQMAERGAELTPQLVPPQLYGIESGTDCPAEVYCALVLERIGAAALAQKDAGDGLFVDHADLPGAVAGAILPHFGIAPDEAMSAALATVAARDAKHPARPFTGRTGAIDPAIRAAADAHLAEIHARLKAVHGPQSLL